MLKKLIAYLSLGFASSMGVSQDKPTLLYRAEVVPGKLFVTVYTHKIETRDRTIPCWSYVSDGMERHGQREIVFTIRRPEGEAAKDFPRELFQHFGIIYSFAERGNLVDVGGFSIFRPDMPFLGKKGKWGLMYLPAAKFAGIEIPANALTAVLIRDDETDLIQRMLFYRIATSFGTAYRHYPYPSWSDLDRKAVVSTAQFEKSILNHVRLLRIPGIMVRMASEAKELSSKAGTGWGDTHAKFGDEIILRISRKALPRIQAYLPDLSDKVPVALLTDPDSGADTRLSWLPDSGKTIGIFPNSGQGRWVTGGFIILSHGESITDGGGIREDGFVMGLSPASWKKVKESIAAGLPVKIPPAGEGASLEVEYFPPLDSGEEKVYLGTDVVFYNPNAQLLERSVDVTSFSDYIGRLEKAAISILADYARPDARGLLIAVGVKPGKKVKVWCEAVEGEIPEMILRKLEAELEKIPTLDIKKGPIAFSLAGPLWNRTVKEFPKLPDAWMKACSSSGKDTTVPDGLFKIIWPD